MALVKFVSTDAISFTGLTKKDENTLYFVSDERKIYKGAVPFSGGIYKQVTALPDVQSAEVNVLYVVGENGDNVAYFDGTKFVQVVKPSTVAADLSALVKRVAIAEGEITNAKGKLETIQGTGEGSITKAATDAKDAAITAAAKDAETKANAALASARTYAEEKASAAQTAAEKTAADNLATAKTALQVNIDKKANIATTLAGYGIADAYTKEEVNSEITSAVANAHHLKREIVKTLPAVDTANEDTIYMVPDAGDATSAGSAQSTYTEYMLINGAFERIGTSDADLSNYFTKDQVTSAIGDAKTAAATDATTKASQALTDAKADAKTKADTAEKNAKAYADSLAPNYATANQGAKADTALQAADIAESTANGKISVKGTDIAVHGLGSAAYVGTDTFATSAQGEKADSALQAADITTGKANGNIAVKGIDVAVKGLDSAAYKPATAFDSAGLAEQKANAALEAAKAYVDSALTWGTI